MRLKFKARKAEVDRHRKQCTQWNKLEQKLQEKTQKTMQSILRKNAEKSSKNDKRVDNGF